MVSPDPTWTDILQTVFLGGQLALLVLAAIFGWSQLNEAKELREEQTRPFVVIDLDSTIRPFFDLVVKNIGSTMARDVRVTFDPPARTTEKGVNLDRLKAFREGISTLPPGKELRTFFDSGPDRNKSDLPDSYEVTVTYQDQSRKRSYEETIDLDFGLYWNRLTIDRKEIHDIAESVEAIGKELGKWTAKLGGGVLHVTPEDVKDRVSEVERQFEERDSEERGPD